MVVPAASCLLCCLQLQGRPGDLFSRSVPRRFLFPRSHESPSRGSRSLLVVGPRRPRFPGLGGRMPEKVDAQGQSRDRFSA